MDDILDLMEDRFKNRFKGGIFNFGDSEYFCKLLPSQEKVGQEIDAILTAAKLMGINFNFKEGYAGSHGVRYDLNIRFAHEYNMLSFDFAFDGWIRKIATVINFEKNEYYMKEFEQGLEKFRNEFYK